MKSSVFFLILLFLMSTANAARTDTVVTFSNSMKKEIRAVVITPDNYATVKALPVVYLLHGYSDNYSGWVTKAGGFEHLADDYQLMIVCPDGGISSWYWDSPVDSSYRYETYIIKELVPFIDSKYRTLKTRAGRAITGLSMGGHGALYLAFRHQNLFGAAGSMSGGVDIRPFPQDWDMAQRLGSFAENPERWNQYTVINMLHLITPQSLALTIDCGTEDFFFDANRRLHALMMERNIPHQFIVRPGAHTWQYWQDAIQYQLLFMHGYFRNSIKK